MENKNENYLNTHVTHGNMSELIQDLKFEEQVEQICRDNSLNIDLLESLFTMQMRGFNNKQIAQKIGVHRVTVQRYAQTLKKLKESEFNKLIEYIFKGKNETKD